MTKGCFTLALLLLAGGCAKHEMLPAQGATDVVAVKTLAGAPALPRRVIREKDQVDALVAFVNSLPDSWSIPWYGSSVGRVYFEFISGGKNVGTFYVGTDFFGRVAGKAYTQGASQSEIEELGKITDMAVWDYLNGKAVSASPEPTAALAKPVVPVTPAPRAFPAAAQPTRHP